MVRRVSPRRSLIVGLGVIGALLALVFVAVAKTSPEATLIPDALRMRKLSTACYNWARLRTARFTCRSSVRNCRIFSGSASRTNYIQIVLELAGEPAQLDPKTPREQRTATLENDFGIASAGVKSLVENLGGPGSEP